MLKCATWEQLSVSVSLPAVALTALRTHLVRHFDKTRAHYYPELNGIILDYRNIRILNNLGIIRQESADINLDVQVDILVFQPKIGDRFQGTINRKCATHLSVLVHKIFNAVIPKSSNDTNSEWIGDNFEVGQTISFTTTMVDFENILPFIKGSLDDRSLIVEDVSKYEISKFTPPLVLIDNINPDTLKLVQKNNRKRKLNSPIESDNDDEKSDTFNKKNDFHNSSKPNVNMKANVTTMGFDSSDSGSSDEESFNDTQTAIMQRILSARKSST